MAILRVAFITVGLILQLVAGGVGIRTKEWLDRAHATTGTVVSHVSRSSSKGRTYAERVTFADEASGEHEFVSSFSSSSPFAVGATVPVRFDPADPTSAAIDTHFRNWFPAGLLFVMGRSFR